MSLNQSKSLWCSLFAALLLTAWTGSVRADGPPVQGQNPPAPVEEGARKRGGSDNGGSPGSTGLTLEWCTSITSILDASRTQAEVDRAESDYETAKVHLREGLDNAIAASARGAGNGALTLKMLTTGLELSRNLDESGADLETLRIVSVEFLFEYYALITRANVEVDRAFTIPNLLPENQNNAEFRRRYEIQFISFARLQLEFLLQKFTSIANERVIPLYSDRIYLKLAEKMTHDIAELIDGSLFKNNYGVVARKLAEVSRRLAEFNSGVTNGGYRKAPYAVALSYRAIAEAINDLRPAAGGQ